MYDFINYHSVIKLKKHLTFKLVVNIMIILNSHYYHIHLPQIISMKKEKPVSPVKAAKKTIKDRLVKELETIKAQLEKKGISIELDIEKEAKKLTKKITKHAKTESPEKSEPAKETPVEKPVASLIEATPAKPKAAKKAAAPKTTLPEVAPAPAAKSTSTKTGPKNGAAKK